MKELTESQRKELIIYMWKTGFLIQSKPFFELKTKRERLERIRSLINEGYRIQLWGKDFDIVNIQGICISQEITQELIEVFKYLRGEEC